MVARVLLWAKTITTVGCLTLLLGLQSRPSVAAIEVGITAGDVLLMSESSVGVSRLPLSSLFSHCTRITNVISWSCKQPEKRRQIRDIFRRKARRRTSFGWFRRSRSHHIRQPWTWTASVELCLSSKGLILWDQTHLVSKGFQDQGEQWSSFV